MGVETGIGKRIGMGIAIRIGMGIIMVIGTVIWIEIEADNRDGYVDGHIGMAIGQKEQRLRG